MNEDSIQDLRSKGLRATKTRIAILNVFKNTKSPLGAQEIKTYLSKTDNACDLATIYRFLNSFIDRGLLYKIELGEGKYRFELATLPHHHHFFCNNCNTVKDIQIDDDDFIKRFTQNSKFKIDHHHLELFGLCEICI